MLCNVIYFEINFSNQTWLKLLDLDSRFSINKNLHNKLAIRKKISFPWGIILCFLEWGWVCCSFVLLNDWLPDWKIDDWGSEKKESLDVLFSFLCDGGSGNDTPTTTIYSSFHHPFISIYLFGWNVWFIYLLAFGLLEDYWKVCFLFFIFYFCMMRVGWFWRMGLVGVGQKRGEKRRSWECFIFAVIWCDIYLHKRVTLYLCIMLVVGSTLLLFGIFNV